MGGTEGKRGGSEGKKDGIEGKRGGTEEKIEAESATFEPHNKYPNRDI